MTAEGRSLLKFVTFMCTLVGVGGLGGYQIRVDQEDHLSRPYVSGKAKVFVDTSPGIDRSSIERKFFGNCSVAIVEDRKLADYVLSMTWNRPASGDSQWASAAQRRDGAFAVPAFDPQYSGTDYRKVLDRVCDAIVEDKDEWPSDGLPGKSIFASPALLNNAEQEAAFARLPDHQFAFKDAKLIYGKTDDPTRKFLCKCMDSGILEQLGRGIYRKLQIDREHRKDRETGGHLGPQRVALEAGNAGM